MWMFKTVTQSTLISSFQALSIIDLTLNIRLQKLSRENELKVDICYHSNGWNSVKKL